MARTNLYLAVHIHESPPIFVVKPRSNTSWHKEFIYAIAEGLFNSSAKA
jgi:hypothetical protein